MIPHVREISRGALSEAPLRKELVESYFVFDALVSGEPRIALNPLMLPRPMHEAAVRATEAVAQACLRVRALATANAHEAALYRFAPDIMQLAAASERAHDRAGLWRVDLLLQDDNQFVACEVNADCPGGHNEAYGLPRLTQKYAGIAGPIHATNPTFVLESLAAELVALSGGKGSPEGLIALVFATAYAEDLQVCAIIEKTVRALGGRVKRAAISTLLKGEGSTLTLRGERVSVLYRYFPAEYMEGLANLGAMAHAIEAGNLKTLSAFVDIYPQSKLCFARYWANSALHDDEADRAVAQTYRFGEIDLRTLVNEKSRWVVKKALGRVGDEVFVGPLFDKESWASVLRVVAAREQAGEVWIVQRYVTQKPIPTPWGPQLMTLGAYVQNGRFCGYFARITEQSHATHDALVVPVFVEGDAQRPSA